MEERPNTFGEEAVLLACDEKNVAERQVVLVLERHLPVPLVAFLVPPLLRRKGKGGGNIYNGRI